MKIIPIAVFTILNSTALFAQRNISEGSLTYSISTDASSGTGSSILNGATNTIFVKGTSSKTEMVSALGKETTLYDGKTGTGAILKEYSGQKLLITLTKENWQQHHQQYIDLVFTDQATRKSINGYSCTLATTQLKDGSQLSVYYTNEVVIVSKDCLPLFKNLKGVPVEYEIASSKLTFKYSLQKIDVSAIPASKFDLPKSGFRTMSYEESKQ